MSRRLADQYQPGEQVEIVFATLGERRWLPAVVQGHEPPGMWVVTADGRRWFVTNTRRVRPAGRGERPGHSGAAG